MITREELSSSLREYLDNVEKRVPYVSVKEFGAKGDGVSDDTYAITKAVEYATENNIQLVLIPGGTYLINNITFTGLENITIEFLNEVIFSQYSNKTELAPLIDFTNCNNITLKGTIKITLEQLGNGEFKHCFNITSCSNIYIDNLYGYNATGDCLCINDSNTVVVKNIKAYDCARSAVVLLSGENIYVDNIEHYITYKSHLNYQSGFHIEPHIPYNKLKNININNITVESDFKAVNSNYGLIVHLAYITKTDSYCSINIGNLNVRGCRYVCRVVHFNDDKSVDLKGFVNIGNVNSNECFQFNIMNWLEGRSPMLTIKNSHFSNNNPDPFNYKHGDQGLFYIESQREGTIGNMNLGNISFSGGNVYTCINFAPYKNTDTGLKENISSKIQYNLISNDGMKQYDGSLFSSFPVVLGNCVADYTRINNCPISICSNTVGGEIDTIRPFGSEYNNEGATEEITMWLSYTRVGSKMKFVVRENMYFNITTDGRSTIEPGGYNAPNGKWLKSNTIGSYLVIQKISDNCYYIIEKVGVWEDATN